MKNIRHVFFDLDHTLWDYDRNAQETLQEIHINFNLIEYVDLKKFIQTFYAVNDKLWDRYNRGLINREDIRQSRFSTIFSKFGINSGRHLEASEFFIDKCSAKPHLMPETIDTLNYLQGKYQLHIITNGFNDVQPKKLKASGIYKYFEVIVTSESSKARKPSPEIFEFALSLAKGEKQESVMIGDNPKTDIHGARDYGLHTVLYDPSGKKRSMADVSIQSLGELIHIL